MSARTSKAPAPAGDPWRFRSYAEAGAFFGLTGENMTALAAESGFPVFSRKVCPALMIEWLKENRARLKDIKSD